MVPKRRKPPRQVSNHKKASRKQPRTSVIHLEAKQVRPTKKTSSEFQYRWSHERQVRRVVLRYGQPNSSDVCGHKVLFEFHTSLAQYLCQDVTPLAEEKKTQLRQKLLLSIRAWRCNQHEHFRAEARYRYSAESI